MATRFYFGSSTAAPVSPAFDAGYAFTGSATRLTLDTTKVSSAIAFGSTIAFSAGAYGLDRQFVSQPLAAQTVPDATVVTGQLMVRELNSADDVDYIVIVVKVVSNDGSTIRHQLWPFAGYGTIAEFTTAASGRNQTFANGAFDAGTYGSGSPYTITAGDRLVVEIGYGCFVSGSTPEAQGKWGDNASDLPVDDTTTTDGAGWIEFDYDFVFQSGSMLDPFGMSGFFGA